MSAGVTMPEQDVMTLREAAEFLRIHPVTAYRKAKSGEIPGWKTGRVWRCKRSVLEKLLSGEQEAK